jgi:hypothetical protein
MVKKKKEIIQNDSLFDSFRNNINTINNSKLFAGLMIITLNIASKFVTIKLSKSMESYLKHSFSRNVLVFVICWMGCRDVILSFFLTILFIIIMDYLLNENSRFCCLSQSFKDYHISLIENNPVGEEEVIKAKQVIEKFENQQKEKKEDH